MSAQSVKSAVVLQNMRGAIQSFPAAVVRFDFTAKDGKGVIVGDYSGEVTIQGSAFRMLNEALEVYCDGNSKWILNKDAGELTILPNDTTAIDIAENPLGFITRLGGVNSGFISADKPKDSNDLWVIEMTPAAKRSPYKKVVVSVNKADNLPAVIDFVSGDGSSYRISVRDFRNIVTSNISSFVFPQNRTKGLTVTDLR